MLNQERVEEMIRLAVFDQNEGTACRPMIQYFRKDYIAMELLKSLVTGTLAFMILAGMELLYKAEEIVNSLNAIDLRETLISIVTYYLIFMAVYFAVTYVVYYRRYTAGRQKVKKYFMHLKKVEHIYRQEEHN